MVHQAQTLFRPIHIHLFVILFYKGELPISRASNLLRIHIQLVILGSQYEISGFRIEKVDLFN